MKDLARALAVNRAWAVGLLNILWGFALEYCPEGDVGRFSDAALAEELCWPVETSDVLIKALIETRWLDRSESFRLLIHDWPDHCEEYVHTKLARARKFFASGESPKLGKLTKDERPVLERFYETSSARTKLCAQNSTSVVKDAHNLSVPCLAVPCRAIPNNNNGAAQTAAPSFQNPKGNAHCVSESATSPPLQSGHLDSTLSFILLTFDCLGTPETWHFTQKHLDDWQLKYEEIDVLELVTKIHSLPNPRTATNMAAFLDQQIHKAKRELPANVSIVYWPPVLQTDAFRAAWDLWKASRKERKLPWYKPIGETIQLKRLAKWGELGAIAAIEFSAGQQYTGIYEEKKNGSHFRTAPQSTAAYRHPGYQAELETIFGPGGSAHIPDGAESGQEFVSEVPI